MAAIIERATLVDYVQSETTLTQYAGSNEDAITRAVGVGNNDVLAALRRSGRYTSASIDVLAVATAPSVLQSIACAIALDDLTAGVAARPDSIGEAVTAARQKLSFIATGNYLVEGVTAGSARIEYSLPSHLSFDNENEDSGDYVRDQDI